MAASAPTIIDEPNVWTGSDFANEEWVVELTPSQLEEIAGAARAAVSAGVEPQDLTPATFPLPGLASLLAAARRTIEFGRGFLVLRGWPADRYRHAENLAAFCGVASHFGIAKVQNYEGESVVDVTDKEKPYDHTSRGYMSNKRLPFHSDGADIVGLLCLGVPAEGGTSLLLSATNLYNTVTMERPDLLDVFLRGYFHHRRGQHDPGAAPVSSERIPVFSFGNGLLHCCYNRNPIDWIVHEGMSLDKREVEALDYFDDLCHRPDMAVAMAFRLGDMQFVNNFVILHSRTEYRDDETHRRHLVRLWLENPQGCRSGRGLLDIYVPGTSRYSQRQASV